MTPAEALVDRFAAWCRGAGWKRISTARAYRLALLGFLRLTGTTDWSAVTVSTFDEYVGRLQLDGISVATIRAHLYAARTFFSWACARGILPHNPTAPGLLRIPADDRAERPVFVLELSELQRLFNVTHAPPVRGRREPARFFDKRQARDAGRTERDRALVRVAYCGALRVSEAAALRWEDVATDARDGTLRVTLRSSKRSRHPATIYLDLKTSAALLDWKRARDAAGRTDPRIFGMSARTCAEVFDRLCREVAIPWRHGRRPTFHILRSSRATHAAEAGLSDREVAGLLRQSGLESIARYVRAATETRKRALAIRSLPWNSRLLAGR